MWTRRTEQEIEAAKLADEAKRKSLLRPLYWALPMSIVCSLLFSFGYRGGATRGVILYSDPIPLLSTKFFFGAIFSFSLLYVVVYLQQRRGSKFVGDDILLCGNCQEPAHANPQRICSCGGRLEPFEYYTWDED